MSSPRVWFITGTSSGLGRSMTEYVLRNGDIAVATLRNPETISDLASRYLADKLLVLKLDARNKRDIADAFAKTKEAFGRIDFVFNNAGYHIVSEAEGVSGSDARDMLDVNFWGAVNVTKLAVKFLREANPPGVGGSILQMSYVKDREVAPGSESCSAAKYALEAIKWSLAQEVDPRWKIKVTVVEPGPFNAKVEGPAANQVLHQVISQISDPALPTPSHREGIIPDGDKGVAAVYKTIELPNPNGQFYLGQGAITGIRGQC